MKDYLAGLKNCNKIADVSCLNLFEDKVQAASVVIVTYNTGEQDLKSCLNALTEQTQQNFEIIIVDNNDQLKISPVLSKYRLKYIRLKGNFGVNVARNIGTVYSNGDIIIFLDDDAIPGPDFVEGHIHAYKNSDILALRGKSLPKSQSVYNYFASRYDLGSKVIPWMIDLEGNSSFKKNVLLEVGGFNPDLWGHEGIEISYRILKIYTNKNRLIYSPAPIIYHDYSTDFKKYIKKQLRHEEKQSILTGNSQELLKFTNDYEIASNVEKCSNNISLSIRFKLFFIRKITSIIKKMGSYRISILGS